MRFDKDLLVGMCSNFYIVSGVRRINGFKRYQRERWRTGTRYLEDIKNEDCHLFAKVGIEGGKAAFQTCWEEAAHRSRNGANPSPMEPPLSQLPDCLASAEKPVVFFSPPFFLPQPWRTESSSSGWFQKSTGRTRSE